MNRFPQEITSRQEEAPVINQVYDALGCKEYLTKQFIRVCFIAIQVFDHKQANYGPGNISEFGETGVLIRATDKIKRLGNLWRSGREPNDETVEDSYGDLANYGLIALMCRWGLWPNVKPAKEPAPYMEATVTSCEIPGLPR